MNNKFILFLFMVVIAASLGMSGCSSGGSDSSDNLIIESPKEPTPSNPEEPTPTPENPVVQTGIALPSEVSAISADNGSTISSLRAFSFAPMALADLPDDSDYHNANTSKYIDEPALEVWGIVKTILTAIQQTHYADSENLGAGPYKAMVTWQDTGESKKQIQEWTVDSKMTEENGKAVNVVDLWIPEGPAYIQVQAKIYQAPKKAADGTYLDYGVWEISASFGPGGFFWASAEINEEGVTVLRMSEDMTEDENLPPAKTRAMMYKSGQSGYGKLQVPDWDQCFGEGADCSSLETFPTLSGQYAYNQDFLGLLPAGMQVPYYKNRNDKVTITYNYGLFDAVTGADIRKQKTFGFPIRYTDAEDNTRHGYYGAWQGHHEIWADGSTLADGTSVTEDGYFDGEAPTYTVESFPGSLERREQVDADIALIEGIPVETWIGRSFSLIFKDGAWKQCEGESYDSYNNKICESYLPMDMSLLEVDATGRKYVGIQGHDDFGSYEYFYDNEELVESDYSASPGTVYTPSEGDSLHAWVDGPIYIQYTGDFTQSPSGWVKKALKSFDEESWTPTFVDGADEPFVFETNREEYISTRGGDFVVKRIAEQGAESDYQVKTMVKQVVTPEAAASTDVIPAGLVLKNPWEEGSSTYEFDTDPQSQTYLQLRYKTVGGTDAESGIVSGDLVERDLWGLSGEINGQALVSGTDQTPVSFEWSYKENNYDWGGVTYLVDAAGQYVLLDDPIQLESIDLISQGGDTFTMSLQYDGWMHGLPDMYWELSKNDFVLTDEIADKVINVPAGTVVLDAASEASYLVKPLEMGVILRTVTASQITSAGGEVPALTAAENMDLSGLPDGVNIQTAPVPTNATLKYIEGAAVQK